MKTKTLFIDMLPIKAYVIPNHNNSIFPSLNQPILKINPINEYPII